MKSRIIVVIIITILLVACSSSSSSKPVRNEPSSVPTTTVPLATHTSIPTPTETPLSTETLVVSNTPTSPPWKPLEKDLSYGDWYFRCQVTDVSFEVIEIFAKVDATGFLICGRYKIPAGVYDRNDNSLYYWGLLPIKNPTITDHLGERGVERLITVFGLGETYLDTKSLIGKDVAMSVSLPNSKNRALFDTQNIGRFAGNYWGSQSAIDLFAQTGVLSNGNNILYPISLGVIK